MSVTPPATSPDPQAGPSETAGQIKEDEYSSGMGGLPTGLSKRLDQVEERQKRIEELLEGISRALQNR